MHLVCQWRNVCRGQEVRGGMFIVTYFLVAAQALWT